jgi:CheY-like chemotaxis protein
MRILIAEDEPTSRLLLERTLTQWGHEVVVTEDGREARQVLAAADGPASGHPGLGHAD